MLFFGHVFSENGLSPGPKKVEAQDSTRGSTLKCLGSSYSTQSCSILFDIHQRFCSNHLTFSSAHLCRSEMAVAGRKAAFIRVSEKCLAYEDNPGLL